MSLTPTQQAAILSDGDALLSLDGKTLNIQRIGHYWNVFIQGGSGNNIIGGSAYDALAGGTGDDLIEAGPGDSVIHVGMCIFMRKALANNLRVW